MLYNNVVSHSDIHQTSSIYPVDLSAGRMSGRESMAAFVVAQLRKYGELRNDLSSFEGRTRTDNTLVKTRHSGDCAATQTGEFRGWNAARSTPPTP